RCSRRGCLGGGKKPPPFSLKSRGSMFPKSPHVFWFAARPPPRKPPHRFHFRARTSPREGGWAPLRPHPLPPPPVTPPRIGESPPRKGGRRPPWRLLPLLLPLAFVSGPSRNPQVDGPRSGAGTVRRKRSAGKIGL